MNFFNLFNSKPEYCDITLRPYTQNKKISGFTEKNGYSLTLSVIKGSTVGEAIGNFNNFRGPSEQIKSCYASGSKISMSTVINSNLTLHVAN
jgi:hypothetical protein